jgi:hypothetical protein
MSLSTTSLPHGSPGRPERWRSTVAVLALIAALLAPPATAGGQPARHELHSIEVPGGVASALAVTGSKATPERARFLVELTRRFYNSPRAADDRGSDNPLARLVEYMAFFSRAREAVRAVAGPDGDVTLAQARDKRGHQVHKAWAKAFGMELKGGTKAPRLALPSGKDAIAVRLMLSAAGLEVSALAQQLNSGARVKVDLPFDAIPLPLAPELWNYVILERQVAPGELMAAIISSRTASLMYTGLLSLDEETRAWLADRPELLRWIQKQQPSTFVIAAPALRVSNGALLLPGGADARAVWEALADETTADPEKFIRRVLTRDDGLLAFVWASMHRLSPPHRRLALGLGRPSPGERIDTAREAYEAYKAAAANWNRLERPFWRPAFDPSFLYMALHPSEALPQGLPGTERFWRDTFDADSLVPSARDVRRADEDTRAATATFLASRILDSSPEEGQARIVQAMYAARNASALSQGRVSDASIVLRAVRRMPALVLSLERAGIDRSSLVAALCTRADQVNAVGGDDKAALAQAQWQGALAVLLAARNAAAIGSDRLEVLLGELAEAAPTSSGRFDGQIVSLVARWTEQIGARSTDNDAVESAFAEWVTGPASPSQARLTWEGTEYVFDAPKALRTRMRGMRGNGGVSWLALALRLHVASVRLRTNGVSVEDARRELDLLDRDLRAITRVKQPDVVDREFSEATRDALGELRRVTRPRDLKRLGDASSSLMGAADAALGRGLTELVYSRVFADHEVVAVPPAEGARRHLFGTGEVHGTGALMPWRRPGTTTEAAAWHVEGSLLGLDVALSPASLRRSSPRPPSAAPPLAAVERRTFSDTVVLLDRAALSDADRDAISAAIRIGRTVATAASSQAARRDVAASAGMDPIRASLWAWVSEHEPERARQWLSPRELLFTGLRGSALDERWQAWGASATPVSGCLCLELTARGGWDHYAGRVGNPMLAVATPDLQLAVAEHLADMHLPAGLARDVMAVATNDLVNEARAQDADDWRALIDRIHALDRDTFEQYLGLLTVSGPLYPRETPGDSRP